MTFNALHEQDGPLLLCNVWDVRSAVSAENQNFQAIGTSSAAIASMLGYPDGEALPFSELLYIVKRISASTSLPLSVDIESGYSRNPQQIVAHIKQLADLGVVGINIEDSVVNVSRDLLNADAFAATLNTVCNQLSRQNIAMFVNVRTDTILLDVPNAMAETLTRGHLYQQAGANGFFVPGITQASHIKTVVESTTLPLNVMCMPALPDFKQLESLGVKRISMGNFLFNNMYSQLEKTLDAISTQHAFGPIL